jgi:hypothetical protein
MGKGLMIILFGAALGYGAFYYLDFSAKKAAEEARRDPPMPSVPRQQLDNVRKAAKRIEVQGQQQADKAGQDSRD